MAEKLTKEELDILNMYRGLNDKDKQKVYETIKVCADPNTRGIEQYSLLEVQELLGVSYKTALGYIQSDKLPAIRVGGKWKINKKDFEAFAYGR